LLMVGEKRLVEGQQEVQRELEAHNVWKMSTAWAAKEIQVPLAVAVAVAIAVVTQKKKIRVFQVAPGKVFKSTKFFSCLFLDRGRKTKIANLIGNSLTDLRLANWQCHKLKCELAGPKESN